MSEDDIEVLFQDFHEVLNRTDAQYKGRIFGKSVLEATFRAFYGIDLFLGELLAAEDAERARRFLFRVIQVDLRLRLSDPAWAERTAGAYMADDAAGAPYTLHDPEQRLYKVATCQPLGYIDAGGRVPQAEVAAGAVRAWSPRRRPQDFEFLRERMGDLRVGLLRSGEDAIDFEVGIRGETLTSHVGIFATTGMGKSNLMKVLAGQILASQGRYACLLFDPHGEYLEGGSGIRRGLRDHPWARRPAAHLRDARCRRGRDGAPALARRAHARRPADRVRVEPRAGGRDLPADPRSSTRSGSCAVGEEPDVTDLAEQLGRRRRARSRWSSGAPSGSSTCRASRATRRSRRCPSASSTS